MSNSHNHPKPPSEDIQIRNLLIEKNIIDHPRIIRCGKGWKNKKEGQNGWKNMIHPKGLPELNSNSQHGRNLSLRYFCGYQKCRPCRRKLNEIKQKHHFNYNIEMFKRGGTIFLFTLTVPHTIHDSLSSLYQGLKKSLAKLKDSWFWKKLRRDTGNEYHFDNIEITYGEKGFHPHDHITYGVHNPHITTEEIEDGLFKEWFKSTSKNGFKELSRKGFDVIETSLGNHSGSTDIKSIEDSSNTVGSLEYFEREYWKGHTDPDYQDSEMTLDEMGEKIIEIHKTFSKTRNGRVWRNNTFGNLL